MKKILMLSLMVLSLLCVACKADHEKAINEYLSEHLYDADFEIVKIGEMQKFDRVALFISAYQKAKDPELPLHEALRKYQKEVERDGQSLQDILAYSVDVEYKCKNRFGVSSKHKAKFLFDLDKKIHHRSLGGRVMTEYYWMVIYALKDSLEAGAVDRNKFSDVRYKLCYALDERLINNLPTDEIERLRGVLDYLDYGICDE